MWELFSPSRFVIENVERSESRREYEERIDRSWERNQRIPVSKLDRKNDEEKGVFYKNIVERELRVRSLVTRWVSECVSEWKQLKWFWVDEFSLILLSTLVALRFFAVQLPFLSLDTSLIDRDFISLSLSLYPFPRNIFLSIRIFFFMILFLLFFVYFFIFLFFFIFYFSFYEIRVLCTFFISHFFLVPSSAFLIFFVLFFLLFFIMHVSSSRESSYFVKVFGTWLQMGKLARMLATRTTKA